jgi:SAM-dependent methyltransferase
MHKAGKMNKRRVGDEMSSDPYVKREEERDDLFVDFDIDLFAELNEEFRENPMKKFSKSRPSKEKPVEVEKFEKKYASDGVELLAKHFGWDENPPKRVLEFGCGTGFISQFIKQTYPNAEVVCTEIYTDERWVEYPDIEFHEVDISTENYDFLGSFDAIVSFVVFEHVRLPFEALSALYNLLEPGGMLYFSSNLQRGWSASHRYREVFFPWPHLLFQDSVFAEYYEKYLDRPPASGTITSWVNGMTPAHYRDYFRQIGFEQIIVKLSGGRWDEQVEEFYQRFINILGRYSKEDLDSSMMYALLRRPLLNDEVECLCIEHERDSSRFSWESVDGSSYYRVIIRDEKEDEIVDKIEVEGLSYNFEWKERSVDPNFVHRAQYRYRIQHRETEDSGWLDSGNYIEIIPPPAKTSRKKKL